MSNAPKKEMSKRTYILTIVILWVVLLGGLGGGVLFAMQSAGEVENCTVTSTEVTKQTRRSLPFLIVYSSCGDFVSYNIAHRTLIEEGEVYNFTLINGGVVGKKQIEKIERVSEGNPFDING